MKTFPMFLRMRDREVIIVGGDEEAAQKARLILKTEAKLTLVAPELDDELAAVVASGRATHRVSPVGPSRLAQAALVFAASGCPGLDACTVALAREGGALVNAVDQPDLCEAFTPSLVDRDPVVVAIGTEGAAPVLARQIKTQVEGMLEPTLGGFVALAGRLRESVAAQVPKARRRAFWRWAFEGPRRVHGSGSEREAARQLKAAIAAGAAPTDSGTGSIALVGAGPGAPDLLTLRAVRRLQEADVIYYDRLVDPGVLELARRDAERVYVGKAPGAHAWPQEQINRVIVADAKKGRQVVRLKGGDPSLFARAEEEITAARGSGVSVEIVPGVTAASAAAASLGRPLTERGATRRVAFATATGHNGPAIDDLAAALQPGTTLAVYMGLGLSAEISTTLLAEGLPPTTEVAVVEAAGTDRAQTLSTTLADLPNTVAAAGVAAPAMLLIRRPLQEADSTATLTVAA